MKLLFRIVWNTPWWVWVVLVALVGLGYAQTKPRVRKLATLAVTPVVMVFISLLGVYSGFGASPMALAAWFVGIGIAVVLNETLILARGTRYSAATRTFEIPGSWLPLALMMVIFFAWYAFAVGKAFRVDLPFYAPVVLGLGMLQGFVSGVFVGSFLRMWRIAKRGWVGKDVQESGSPSVAP